jgi:hypothetical protein
MEGTTEGQDKILCCCFLAASEAICFTNTFSVRASSNLCQQENFAKDWNRKENFSKIEGDAGQPQECDADECIKGIDS